jgi:outer membrane protein OmpA-like peptidoglycan-associated protein
VPEAGNQRGDIIMSARKDRRIGVLGLAIAACVTTLPAIAGEATENPAQTSKPADVGAVTGLAIGALAGGPVGAVVGAGIGVVIGEGYHRQAQSKAALQRDLQTSEAERTRLSASVAQLDSSLSQERSRNEELGQSLRQTDDLGVDVSFRTNDDSVTVQAISPLLKLGALVASLPQARVRVAGYADPRGAEAWNDALSLRRADSVAAVLMTAGVPRERIVVEGHGKTAATSAAGDLDAYALERRVTVRVQLQDSSQVARND